MKRKAEGLGTLGAILAASLARNQVVLADIISMPPRPVPPEGDKALAALALVGILAVVGLSIAMLKKLKSSK